jgi:hypothetical protein
LRKKMEKIYQRAKNIVHDIWVIRDWNCSSLLNLSDENKKKRLNVASIFVIVFLFVTFYIVIPSFLAHYWKCRIKYFPRFVCLNAYTLTPLPVKALSSSICWLEWFY